MREPRKNPVSRIFFAGHYRIVFYPLVWLEIVSAIKRVLRSPKRWLAESCLRNPREFLMSVLVVTSQTLFLFLAIAATLRCVVPLTQFVLWHVNYSDSPLPRLPVIAYFFLPGVVPWLWLMYQPVDEPQDTKFPSPSSLTPEQGAEMKRAAYQRFCDDPKAFILSTLLFGLQLVFLTSCLTWAIAFSAAMLQ